MSDDLIEQAAAIVSASFQKRLNASKDATTSQDTSDDTETLDALGERAMNAALLSLRRFVTATNKATTKRHALRSVKPFDREAVESIRVGAVDMVQGPYTRTAPLVPPTGLSYPQCGELGFAVEVTRSGALRLHAYATSFATVRVPESVASFDLVDHAPTDETLGHMIKQLAEAYDRF